MAYIGRIQNNIWDNKNNFLFSKLHGAVTLVLLRAIALVYPLFQIFVAMRQNRKKSQTAPTSLVPFLSFNRLKEPWLAPMEGRPITAEAQLSENSHGGRSEEVK